MRELTILDAGRLAVPRAALNHARALISESGDVERLAARFAFKGFVRCYIPELVKTAKSAMRILELGPGYTVIRGLPFADYELDLRKFFILALTSQLGRPTSTDDYRPCVVWHVSPRATPTGGRTPTVTEHDRAAELHTDSSFKKRPERYVALFCIRPAGDGGGTSELLGANALLRALSGRRHGDQCIETLSRLRFAFRVPTSFTQNQREDEPEFLTAPILAVDPHLRYRYDVIVAGYENADMCITPRARWAIDMLRSEILRSTRSSYRLQRGEMLLINNHLAMHGRTAFEDAKRLLLRVRISHDSSMDEVGGRREIRRCSVET